MYNGIDDFLVKPIENKKLVDIFKQWIPEEK
jgi:FixJ family two-component response regulator